MAWKTPRTWEGVADAGETNADQLGEGSDSNRYSLNTEVSDLLKETLPAKAQAAGDLFVASSANTIGRLAIGSNNTYLRIVSGSVAWATATNITNDLPLSAQGDLLVGNSSGAGARLAKPATVANMRLRIGSATVEWGAF